MKFWELMKEIEEGKDIGEKFQMIDENGKKCSIVFRDGTFYIAGVEMNIKDLAKAKEITAVSRRWKPLYSEEYCYINHLGCIEYDTWTDGGLDEYAYKNGNCFETEKEAEKYQEYEKALSEIEKPFVPGLRNYHICYNTKRNCLDIGCCYDTNDAGVKYLGKDLDEVKGFMETWEKEILKYEFGIEEEEDED